MFETGDIPRIRRAWILAITLLRVVGHVLDNVDGERSTWMRKAVDTEHAKIGKDRLGNLIFWEFIREERSLVLKEYEASIFEIMPSEGLRRPVELRGLLIGTDFYIPTGALLSALRWWEKYLGRVEETARALRRASK